MQEITKEQFYAIMGPLNVHPRALENGRESEWLMLTSPYAKVGQITRETWESPNRYFVATDTLRQLAIRESIQQGILETFCDSIGVR